MKQDLFNALLLIQKECEQHDNCADCAFCKNHACLFTKNEWPCDWPLIDAEKEIKNDGKNS